MVNVFYSYIGKRKNVPVVYKVPDVTVLMRENPFRGPLEGVSPENPGFFGP
jgi:hypothetical protein